MTFQVGTWAVDGNTVDAIILRQMLYGSVLGSQGTVGHLDCTVTANSPATSGINIGAGSVIITGAESGNQFQAYFGANIGVDTSLQIAAAGAGGRSDMIVARVEDPTWPGSPWGNPATGQIIFPRVVSNVSPGATSVPGGTSAIPLARIDMPANTSAVQSGYIHDLRQVCNPQRQVQMFTAAGSNPGTLSRIDMVNQWPPGAQWPVLIPPWATQCVIFFLVNDVLYEGTGNGVVRGFMLVDIGGTPAGPQVASTLTLYNVNASSGGGRKSIAGGGDTPIPASLRGGTWNFYLAQLPDGANTGTFLADEATTCTLILEFYQKAALA